MNKMPFGGHDGGDVATTSQPGPQARSNKLARLDAQAAFSSIALALLAVVAERLGDVNWLLPLGLAYFAVNAQFSYRIAIVENPFDPLVWFLLSSGLILGLGVIDPLLLPPTPP